MGTIGIAIVGTGQIALANHLNGLALCPSAKVVALCDSNAATLEAAAQKLELPKSAASTDFHQIVTREDVTAVVIATPNVTHAPIALAAIAAGKHVMCEKPIAMNFAEAAGMHRAAEQAGVVHMTAFTYRFVPAMQYMKHLVSTGFVGTPYHFRAQRFQDWGDRPLGWRQRKDMAATGELGDMLSHRIDYGHFLLGPVKSVTADLKQYVFSRGGQPADVDDWVAILSEFSSGVTGVLESTKLATGRGEGHRGADVVEINGSEGTIVYSTQKPIEIQLGKKGDPDVKTVPVPKEFLVYGKSPRDPAKGDPLVTFRYDQSWEFIDAIEEKRPASPSFKDGASAIAVMDAAVKSSEQRRWVDVSTAG